MVKLQVHIGEGALLETAQRICEQIKDKSEHPLTVGLIRYEGCDGYRYAIYGITMLVPGYRFGIMPFTRHYPLLGIRLGTHPRNPDQKIICTVYHRAILEIAKREIKKCAETAHKCTIEIKLED
ncbi:MAG: hypothetical protein AAB581_02560 [Patescibacteria group bacterium]